MTYTIRTVGCLVEYHDRILILKRNDDKTEGGKWGLVAGKNEMGEDDKQTIIREMIEEIGFSPDPDKLEFVGDWTWEFAEKTVEFPVYRYKLSFPIEIRLDDSEHQAFKWVTADECYKMADLIHGLHDLLEMIGYVQKEL